MRKIKWNRVKICLAVWVICIGCAAAVQKPQDVRAAEQPVAIKSCKLAGGGKKLVVKAKVKTKTKAMGKKLYLLNLNANVSESGSKSAKPLASVKAKKGTVTFKVNYTSSMLYQKFAVAYKSGKKYKLAGPAGYITNPEMLASFTGKGPTAASKKGLQVEELSDSLEIGTKHAVINWTMNSLLNTKAVHKTPFTYKNKTYYFDADQLQRNDELVQAYNAAGVRVTIILLLPKDSASAGTKAMQFGGYSYTLFSSVKTSSKAGCQTFEALMTFLARRYGTKENLVTGWILGNEVNSACIWNYGGGKSLSAYMSNYARAFRICYNAVKSVSKHSKVYISLDHNWNKDSDGSGKRYFSAKATVDKFYATLKDQGKISFQIAYHAYPQGMSDPIFWDDSEASKSSSAKIINFKNLKVLTDYAKKKFGKKCTIMLSEQSFNSSRGEAVQAAAYAYAYYISEGNSMIEAFIYGREFDHPDEMNLGYRWGLCDSWHVKRLGWSVFQYIDSKESFTFTDPLVKYTNIKNWKKIKGFQRTKCSKMPTLLKKGMIRTVESASSTSLKITWDKMNTGDGYEIYRDGKLIATISGNSNVTYTDTGLVRGGTYRYQVRMYKEAPKANDANKRTKLYGTISDAVSGKLTIGTPEINEEKCTVEGTEVKIVWKKTADAGGFEIYRSEAENGSYTLVGTAAGDKTSYKDVAPLSGVTYYYKVRASIVLNGATYYGNLSAPVAKKTMITLTVKMEDGKVKLEWSEWRGAVKYRIFCAPYGTDGFVRTAVVKERTHSMAEYLDAAGKSVPFAAGQVYKFCVRAVMADGKLSPEPFDEPILFTVDSTIQTGGIPESVNTETETESTETAEMETETTETAEMETETTETAETETETTETVETETETAETETKTTETVETEAETTDTEHIEGSGGKTEDTKAADT